VPALAPASRQPPSHALVLTLLALTFTTGLVDAVSFLGLGRVFTANMTGNVVLLGFGLAGVGGLPVLAPVASLAAFATGAAGAGLVLRRGGGDGRDAAAWALAGALLGESLLVAVAAVVAASTDVRPGTVTAGVVIALLALAMGMRNAIVRRLAVAELTTTVLTMTVTGLAADGLGAAPGIHGRRLTALGAMLAGAFAGALLVKSALWPALALAAAVAAALAWTARRA
jgi:uncharacterized membrane protein YoaK (UPF0700 family)